MRGAIKPGTTAALTDVVALPLGYRPVATRVLHYQSCATGSTGTYFSCQMSWYATGKITYEGNSTVANISILDFEGFNFSVY